MYKSKNSKNIINKSSISTEIQENARAITSDADPDIFAFELSFSINSNYQNLIKKINIVSVTPTDFRNTFPNTFLNNASSLTSYDKIYDDDLSEKLTSNLAKNIFYSYHTKNSSANSLTKTVSFLNANLQENMYLLTIPINFSDRLKNNSCRNIRIFFLDENESILDESGIINIDFVALYSQRQAIDKTLFFNKLFSNDIAKNLDINFNSQSFSNSGKISLTGEILSILDAGLFNKVAVEMSYGESIFSTRRLELESIASMSRIEIALNRDASSNTSIFKPTDDNDLISFYYDICRDCTFFGLENFEISLKLKVFYDDDSFESVTKNILKSKDSPFISSLLSSKLEAFFQNSILPSGVNINSSFLEDRIQVSLRLESEGWRNALQSSVLLDRRFYIKDVKINQTTVEIYSNIETNIENKISYRDKSLVALISDNTFTFYTRNVLQDEINVSLTLAFSFKDKEVERTISTGTLARQERKYNLNSINKTVFLNSNKILSNNILVSRTRFNKTLKDESFSIFSYDNITLRNLKDFNEIAYLTGYIEGTQGDVREFLKNAIFKVKNKTELLETNFVNTTCNYFFGETLFNFTTFEQDSIQIRNSSSNSIIEKILTNDFEVIDRVFGGIGINKIRAFFKSTNEKNEADIISKINNLNIVNTLEITVMPLIKSISLFRGLGINNVSNNPISAENEDEALRRDGREIISAEEKLLAIKRIRKRINLDMFNTFYSDRPSLNIRLLEDFKNAIFDTSLTNVPKRLDNLFEKIIKDVSNENRFIQVTNYNKPSIINTFSFDNNFLENNVLFGSLEENFIRRYYDFNKKENEFFLRDVNYDIVFRDSIFNKENNAYQPKKIQLFRPLSRNSLFVDITNSSRFFERSQIQNLNQRNTKIRIGLHFPLRDKNSSLNSSTIDEIEKYSVVNIEGNNYITYNEKYVEEKSEKFSNLFNGIPSTATELVSEGDRYYIKINDINNLLDLNNLDMTSYKDFFEFCFLKNAFYLDFCLLRISVSFKVQNMQKFVFYIFEQKIPFKNLNNKNIDIRRVTQITSNIIT